MLGGGMRSAAKIPSAKPRRRAPGAPAPKPYHHGDLRRVLIDAALQLVGGGAGGGGAAALPGRDRGGACRGAGRRPPRPVSLLWAGVSALGDAQPDPL